MSVPHCFFGIVWLRSRWRTSQSVAFCEKSSVPFENLRVFCGFLRPPHAWIWRRSESVKICGFCPCAWRADVWAIRPRSCTDTWKAGRQIHSDPYLLSSFMCHFCHCRWWQHRSSMHCHTTSEIVPDWVVEAIDMGVHIRTAGIATQLLRLPLIPWKTLRDLSHNHLHTPSAGTAGRFAIDQSTSWVRMRPGWSNWLSSMSWIISEHDSNWALALFTCFCSLTVSSSSGASFSWTLSKHSEMLWLDLTRRRSSASLLLAWQAVIGPSSSATGPPASSTAVFFLFSFFDFLCCLSSVGGDFSQLFSCRCFSFLVYIFVFLFFNFLLVTFTRGMSSSSHGPSSSSLASSLSVSSSSTSFLPVTLRFSEKFCVLGSVCLLRSVPLSEPWDWEGLTEAFDRKSAGISGPKLPLWADFSFQEFLMGLA